MRAFARWLNQNKIAAVFIVLLAGFIFSVLMARKYSKARAQLQQQIAEAETLGASPAETPPAPTGEEPAQPAEQAESEETIPTYYWIETSNNAFLAYEVRSVDQLLTLYDRQDEDGVETRARFKKLFAYRGWDTDPDAIRARLAKLVKQDLGQAGDYNVGGWRVGHLTWGHQPLGKHQVVLADGKGLTLKLVCGNPLTPYGPPRSSKPAPPPAPTVQRPEPPKVCHAPAIAPEPVEECQEEEWIAPVRSRNQQVAHSTPQGHLGYQAGHTTVGYARRTRHVDETCGPGTAPPQPPTDW